MAHISLLGKKPADVTPGGADGQLQYNDGGSFGGVTGVTLEDGAVKSILLEDGNLTLRNGFSILLTAHEDSGYRGIHANGGNGNVIDFRDHVNSTVFQTGLGGACIPAPSLALGFATNQYTTWDTCLYRPSAGVLSIGAGSGTSEGLNALGSLLLKSATLSGVSLTGSQADSVLGLAATWNTTGAPNVLNIAVTDTASAAGSRIIKATVGEDEVFRVSKGGDIFSRSGAIRAHYSLGFYGIEPSGPHYLMFQMDYSVGCVSSIALGVNANQSIGWFDNGAWRSSLWSPSTGVIEQKSDDTPQSFRIYGATTGSKYLSLGHNGTNARIAGGLPTSSAGLSSGEWYSDSGVVKIVP